MFGRSNSEELFFLQKETNCKGNAIFYLKIMNMKIAINSKRSSLLEHTVNL